MDQARRIGTLATVDLASDNNLAIEDEKASNEPLAQPEEMRIHWRAASTEAARIARLAALRFTPRATKPGESTVDPSAPEAMPGLYVVNL